MNIKSLRFSRVNCTCRSDGNSYLAIYQISRAIYLFAILLAKRMRDYHNAEAGAAVRFGSALPSSACEQSFNPL